MMGTRLVYTALGTFLSALKVVVCNKFLKGTYEMHPLDLLARVAPLAFVQTAIMVYLLEWYDCRTTSAAHHVNIAI